jgi:hypothetical protein
MQRRYQIEWQCGLLALVHTNCAVFLMCVFFCLCCRELPPNYLGAEHSWKVIVKRPMKGLVKWGIDWPTMPGCPLSNSYGQSISTNISAVRPFSLRSDAARHLRMCLVARGYRECLSHQINIWRREEAAALVAAMRSQIRER